MSASPPSASGVNAAAASHAPQIEALFLVRFDKKAGYTMAWKRTKSDMALEDAVEYKALPSGLHAVEADLVYFTHEGYAGLSAFARGAGSAAERNATFVSVGVLVHSHGRVGRLGRAWLLAARLETLAAALAGDDGETVAPLEEFWDEHAATATTHAASGPGQEHADESPETLPQNHPAQAMTRYLDTLGPLAFRLHQAALLRKRILFVGSAPVRAACEFVYSLAVLSTISPRDSQHFVAGTEALLRLPALFSIGVHDIPTLEGLRPPSHGGHTPGAEPMPGWAACTTDGIIATKPQLYDIIVELPPAIEACGQQRRWPRIRTSDGSIVKASQRDVARYRLLHKELFHHRRRSSQASPGACADGEVDDNQDAAAPLLSRDAVDSKRADDDFNEAYDDSVVEPMTWSRFAYQGFMWWASAGERDAYTATERDRDREQLLDDLANHSQSVEAGVIAYFHGQTALLLRSLSQIIQGRGDGDGDGDSDHADDDGDAGDGEVLVVDREDLSRMGLDTWSEADRAFVSEFASLYLGRPVEVKGSEVDCCGLRVPVF